MPIGMLLEAACRGDERLVVTGAGHKLQANGEVLIGEAAWHGDRREATKIPDCADSV